MGKYLKIFLIVILVMNILALDIFLYLFWDKKTPAETGQNDNCPSKCDDLINERIKSITIPTATLAPTTKESPAPTIKKDQNNPVKKIRNTQYIPVSGGGSTLENKWADLSGTEFYIDTGDYSNIVEAYFEANMKLINGNGLAYLRLFDVTAGIEVWGSEISTSSQSFTSVSSGKLTLRPGNHLYRVQAKSLTADTTVFNSGKVKVVTEN